MRPLETYSGLVHLHLRLFPCTGAKIRELQCPFQTSAFSISDKALPENPYSESYPQDFVIRNGSQLQVLSTMLW